MSRGNSLLGELRVWPLPSPPPIILSALHVSMLEVLLLPSSPFPPKDQGLCNGTNFMAQEHGQQPTLAKTVFLTTLYLDSSEPSSGLDFDLSLPSLFCPCQPALPSCCLFSEDLPPTLNTWSVLICDQVIHPHFHA